MICGNILTNIICYQYCIHYHYRLVFIICVTPLIYIAMDCIKHYVFFMFKQMGAHILLNCAPNIIHIRSTFKHSLAVKQFFHDEILHTINPKSYGLVHDVCVKKICVCCMVFADALF